MNARLVLPVLACVVAALAAGSSTLSWHANRTIQALNQKTMRANEQTAYQCGVFDEAAHLAGHTLPDRLVAICGPLHDPVVTRWPQICDQDGNCTETQL